MDSPFQQKILHLKDLELDLVHDAMAFLFFFQIHHNDTISMQIIIML